jgi:hypothetical protein
MKIRQVDLTKGCILPSFLPSFRNRFENHPFITTFLIAFCLLGLIGIFYRFLFQLCDDIFVLLILKGAGITPTPSEYNLFLNALLSLGLKNLYTYFPNVQWYSLFLVIVQTFSLWAILLACQFGTHKLLKTLLTLASSAVYVYLITVLQWTTASTLAATGGYILLAALWQDKDHHPYWGSLALVFILFSSSVLIRPSAFFYVSLLAMPTAVFLGWKSFISPSRSLILKFMGTVAVVLFLAIGADAFYYNRDPEWSKAVRYFNLHSELINGHRLHYDETTKPIFDSIGWTQNDLDLFLNWYFLDEDTYSIEKLEKLKDSFTHFYRQETNVEAPFIIFTRPSVQYVFWSFILILFFLPKSCIKYMSANVLWTTLILTSLAIYLKVPERVFLPPILLLMNMAIFFAVPRGSGKDSPRWVQTTGKLMIVLVLLMGFRMMIWEKKVAGVLKKNSDGLNETLKSFSPQKDELYVIWDSAFPYEAMGAFDKFDVFKKINLVTLVWFQRTPTTKAMLERFGVKNLFRDFVDNPKLYLICTPWEVNAYKVYMIQKFQMNTSLEPVFSSPYFTAYRVHSVK